MNAACATLLDRRSRHRQDHRIRDRYYLALPNAPGHRSAFSLYLTDESCRIVGKMVAYEGRGAHMVQVTEQAVADTVAAIVQEIDPEQIILFGSRARGDARSYSDVDLLIVEDKPFGPTRSRWKEMERLWPLLVRFRLAADVLLYSRDEITHWQHSKNHIIARAMNEGRVLYERS